MYERVLEKAADQTGEYEDGGIKMATYNDIIHRWIHDDTMNLCEFCTEIDNPCKIGDKCSGFQWNGKEN